MSMPSEYTGSHIYIYVKITTLVAYSTTKGNIFPVNQYILPQLMLITILKNY